MQGKETVTMAKDTEKSKRKWVLYVLFGIFLTLGLLYYRFPSEAVEGLLRARVEKIDPRLEFSMEKVSPSLTIGLKFFEINY